MLATNSSTCSLWWRYTSTWAFSASAVYTSYPEQHWADSNVAVAIQATDLNSGPLSRERPHQPQPRFERLEVRAVLLANEFHYSGLFSTNSVAGRRICVSLYHLAAHICSKSFRSLGHRLRCFRSAGHLTLSVLKKDPPSSTQIFCNSMSQPKEKHELMIHIILHIIHHYRYYHDIACAKLC